MSETRDSVNEAVRANRLLLARLQVRDDALAEEIAAIETERSTAQGELHEALGAKRDALRQERAQIAAEREDVRNELAALDKLSGRLPAIEAQTLAREALALAGVDPDAPPPSVGQTTGRLTDDEARAQLAALKAQRSGSTGAASPSSDPESPATPAAPNDDAPRKRSL